jgi:hypothetical protein
MKPSEIARRLHGTPIERMDERQLEFFKASLDVVYGADTADRKCLIQGLQSIDEQLIAVLMDEAREVLVGAFHVFGRRFQAEPRRPPWHLDFISGHTFPKLLPSKLILPAPYPGGYEIIVPWQFSRFLFAFSDSPRRDGGKGHIVFYAGERGKSVRRILRKSRCREKEQ